MAKWNLTSTFTAEIFAPNREEGASWSNGTQDLPPAINSQLEAAAPQSDANDGKTYELEIDLRVIGYYHAAILNPPDCAQPEESEEERTVEGVTLLCNGQSVQELKIIAQEVQEAFEKEIGEADVDYEVPAPEGYA